MSYISKFDTKFITYVSRKYDKIFSYFDDYATWLYDKYNRNDSAYYVNLEKDLWEYSDFQTGSPRKRNNDRNEKV